MNKFSFVGKNNNNILIYVEVIMNKNKRKRPDGEKIFSIVATVAIVAALAVGVVTVARSIRKTGDHNYIDLNQAKETTQKDYAVVEPEKNPEKNPVKNPETEPPRQTVEAEATEPDMSVAATKETETVAVNAPVYNFNESSSLIWPVEGDIVLGYNMDNTIYFPTLKQYQCNPAIVISADEDTEVISAAKGIVEDVYEDPVVGTTMVISIGNGYKLVYGQLKDLAVGISDQVEPGDVIGKVSEPTKYYTVEGSNLYFALKHGDAPVDPTIYLIGNE
jgi:murein DD-endopeptidase MepM/ murein hydrolase activator NlpD